MRKVICELITGLFEVGKKYQVERCINTIHQQEIHLFDLTVLRKDYEKIKVQVSKVDGKEDNYICFIYYYEIEAVEDIE